MNGDIETIKNEIKFIKEQLQTLEKYRQQLSGAVEQFPIASILARLNKLEKEVKSMKDRFHNAP
jgi:uncharacterized protein involved in exopolysaccharide biosynthesis